MPKFPKTPKGWNSSCVLWYAPNRKRPIAFSTKAASDLIVMLSQDYETIEQVKNAINYDAEAEKVLLKFIDLGYSGVIAKDWFK